MGNFPHRSEKKLRKSLQDWLCCAKYPNFCSDRTVVRSIDRNFDDEDAVGETRTEYGTFAARKIKAGEAIGEYVGDLRLIPVADPETGPDMDQMSQEMQTQDADALAQHHEETEYQIEFDGFHGFNLFGERTADGERVFDLVVDAKQKGNETAFINDKNYRKEESVERNNAAYFPVSTPESPKGSPTTPPTLETRRA